MTLTLSQIVLILVALAGGAGTIGAAFAAGVLQRWIRPAMRAEIAAHEATVATADAQNFYPTHWGVEIGSDGAVNGSVDYIDAVEIVG